MDCLGIIYFFYIMKDHQNGKMKKKKIETTFDKFFKEHPEQKSRPSF